MGDVFSSVIDEFSAWHGAGGRPICFEGEDKSSNVDEESEEDEGSSSGDKEEQNGKGRINAIAYDVITISSSSTRSSISQEVDHTPSASWENAAKELER